MSAQPQGCTYSERPDKPPCNKVCDPGETMCRHHLLLQTQTPAKRKPPAAAPDGERRYKTPRGYDQ